jgi:type II secretory pathway component PulF
MQFSYAAKSNSGATVNGTIEAATLSDAKRLLRAQGMFPLTMSQSALGARAAIAGKARTGAKVPKTEIMMMTSQLAIMSRTGVDLADALKSLAGQCRHQTLKKVLADVYDRVSSGQTVSSALALHADAFSPAYVAAIAAGEASGSITEVLTRLEQLLKNEIRLKSAVWSIMAYPLVLLLVAGIVVCALLLFVLPQFSNVFRDLGTTPPPMTAFLLESSLWVRGKIVWLAAGVGIVGFGLARLFKTEAARLTRDRLLLSLPLMKRAMQAILTGRVFRLLGTILETGVPLLDGLRLCRTTVGNSLFQRLFTELEDNVINGEGIGAGLAAAPMIPSSAAQMVQTAEKSGRLGAVLSSVGEFYEEEGERQLRQFVKLLEPFIIVFMGAIVALVVLAVMLPLLDVSTASS